MAAIVTAVQWVFGVGSRRSSLRTDFAWTFTGQTVYSACQWGVLILLAKLGNPEMVGAYALGQAIAAPINMGSQLQLRSVQTSDVKNGLPFSDYLGFRLLSSLLALAAIAGTVLVSHGGLQSAVLILVGAGQCIEGLSDIYWGNLQLHDHMDRIAVSMMLRGPLGLTALAAGLVATGSVLWAVAGLVAARLAVMLVYDARPAVHGIASALMRPHFRPGVQKKLLWTALPLGVVAALVSLTTNIPRYFIEHHMGARELGIFSAIAFLLSVGNIFVNALAQAAFVRLAKHNAEGKFGAFNALLLKLAGIGALLGAAGMVFAKVAGRELLTILYRPEYAAQSHLLVWMMAAAGVSFIGQFLGYGMTAARHFAAQIPLFAVLAAAVTAGSWFLIPRYGLLGAILALLAAGVVQVCGSVAILWSGQRRRAKEAYRYA